MWPKVHSTILNTHYTTFVWQPISRTSWIIQCHNHVKPFSILLLQELTEVAMEITATMDVEKSLAVTITTTTTLKLFTGQMTVLLLNRQCHQVIWWRIIYTINKSLTLTLTSRPRCKTFISGTCVNLANIVPCSGLAYATCKHHHHYVFVVTLLQLRT